MELINVSYNETDDGIPGICVNNDITFTINNISFVKSFISFVNSEMVFKLANLSGNKLSFSIVDDTEEHEIIAVYFNKMLVGKVELEQLTEVMYEVLATLQRLKKGN